MKLRRRKRTKSGNGNASQPRPREQVEVRPVDAEAEEDKHGAAVHTEAALEPEPVGSPERPRDRRRFRKAVRQTASDNGTGNKTDGGREEPAGDGEPKTGDGTPRLVIKGHAVATPVKIAPRPAKPANGNTGCEPGVPTGSAPELPRLDNETRRGGHVKPERGAEMKKPAPKPAKKSKEAEWAGKKIQVNWRWAALISFGLTATVIGSLAVVDTLSRVRANEGLPTLPELEVQVDREQIADRAGFLTENPGDLFDEAADLLARYAAARTPEEALPTLRSSQRQEKEKFARHWVPWANRPMLERSDQLQYAIAADQAPPFLTLLGLKSDYSRFTAYFTRENGKLRIDWEATEMFSDIPIGQLPKSPPTCPAVIRCQVREKPFYTRSLPEERYRSYLIENPRTTEFVWGYAERDGEADMKLQGALIAGAAFLEHNEAERLTVLVSTPKQRETNSQFLITEMLHIEWVLP